MGEPRIGDYSVDTERIVWKRSFGLRGPLVLPLTVRPESALAADSL